jgi:hypothetical protein
MEGSFLVINMNKIFNNKYGKIAILNGLTTGKPFVISIVLLLLIPIWLFYIAPNILALPEDYTYSADIVSLDNFYDLEKKGFGDPISSDTLFTYSINGKRRDTFLIDNLFDVRSPDGAPIFSVVRNYAIDRYSRKHVKNLGDERRDGYLFAPPGLKKGQNYKYWHVNYNSPAPMKFVGETFIEGLKVYIYEANFISDQTLELLHLPGVPDNLGIELDIKLTQWIEPVSGRMIKYEDSTTAYYYKISTGQRVYPWNRFSNRYSADSILEQVRAAYYEKQFFIFVNILVPIIIGMMALIFFIIGFAREYYKKIDYSAKSGKV